jgi:5-methylcytosine-specific restriction endonuclease McrA
MVKAKDITGEIYGELTALRISGKDNFGRNKWLFKCTCGNETEAALNNVLTGTTKSCGCLRTKPHRRIDLLNKRFGRLVVVSYAETKNGKAIWHCVCDCGKELNVSYLRLSRDHTKSCGCLQYEMRRKLHLPKNPNATAAWAREVKKKTPYCIKCNSTLELNAHHIQPYSTTPSMRNDPANGVTLCKICHVKFHLTYGKSTHGLVELNEFLTKR